MQQSIRPLEKKYSWPFRWLPPRLNFSYCTDSGYCIAHSGCQRFNFDPNFVNFSHRINFAAECREHILVLYLRLYYFDFGWRLRLYSTSLCSWICFNFELDSNSRNFNCILLSSRQRSLLPRLKRWPMSD